MRFRPAASDLLSAVAVLALGIGPALHERQGVGGLLLVVGLSAPLLWRRRHPSAVFAVLAAVAFVQWLTGLRSLGDAALLLALYTVAVTAPRRRSLTATGVLLAGVLMASIRFAPSGDGVAGSIVFLSGLVVAALFLGTSVRNRRAYLSSVEDRAQRLERERDSQVRLAATAERTRIAREMHDIVAHSLSVMITLADGAALANQAHHHDADEAMRHVAATGRDALAQMRRLLGVLREEQPGSALLAPQPGLSQLDRLLGEVRAAGLPVRLRVVGRARAGISADCDVTAYRVVQEALTNVLKHTAGAGDVEVALRWQEQCLHVEVLDDGEQQPRSAARDSSAPAGHGLTGMRERAALFGGAVTAGPAAPRGWLVHAVLPFVDPEQAQAPSRQR